MEPASLTNTALKRNVRSTTLYGVRRDLFGMLLQDWANPLKAISKVARDKVEQIVFFIMYTIDFCLLNNFTILI